MHRAIASNFVFKYTQTLVKVSQNDIKPSILIVEDNEELREFMVEKLSVTYNCSATENGTEGVEMAQKSIPDLVITDWMMPGLKGIELVEVLKSGEDTNHIPIIMLTAKDKMEDKLSGLSQGADDYLTKPFHTGELLLRCNNILHSREVQKNKLIKEFLLKPPAIEVVDSDQAFLDELKQTIEAHMVDPDFSIVKLQEMMGMSRMGLNRRLRSLTNFSPVELIRAMKMERALSVFKSNKGISISEVGYQLGFSDPSYFTKCFKQYYGYPPGELS